MHADEWNDGSLHSSIPIIQPVMRWRHSGFRAASSVSAMTYRKGIALPLKEVEVFNADPGIRVLIFLEVF